MTARIGEKEEGLNSWTMPSPSRPASEMIQAVTVVPTLAPMMMPTAWVSFITPELTKPTTITVVADEDWMTAVTASPRKNPLTGLEVSRSKIVLSLLPAARSRPWPMTDMPNKNRDSPPSMVRKSKISIAPPTPSPPRQGRWSPCRTRSL